MLDALKRLCGRLAGVHVCTDYTPWSGKKSYEACSPLLELIGGKPETYVVVYQERACKECGKIRVRQIKY